MKVSQKLLKWNVEINKIIFDLKGAQGETGQKGERGDPGLPVSVFQLMAIKIV